MDICIYMDIIYDASTHTHTPKHKSKLCTYMDTYLHTHTYIYTHKSYMNILYKYVYIRAYL